MDTDMTNGFSFNNDYSPGDGAPVEPSWEPLFEPDLFFDDIEIPVDEDPAATEYVTPSLDTAEGNLDNSTTAPLHQTIQPRSDKEWDDRRLIIETLYWTENKTLPVVMRIMKHDHGFDGTGKQYKRQFARWGIEKNVKSDEMRKIMQIQERRLLEGKETQFTVRNRPVPDNNIKRFAKRTQPKVTADSPAYQYRVYTRVYRILHSRV
ncbi:Clr5 domain-containing protein [Phialemonium atrogriseum]|uniref:Clr5 domain-containing protein n=1 Tax=Phialemonium atrogriseum TaxID=1093897 RepID=A0AAJ0C8I2_9PEZI|nr:Clr5 domain-containing protein [Phialemonium atrogriseum]KAK1772119.1 Clr5 domain-containing protein [Phialemonium atrogriseum]